MNRLTERCLNEEGKPFYRFTEDSGIEIRYRYCVGIERAIVRLGFYEDAGLEPEEIRALKAQLAESQRREKAAVEDLYKAAPCFACVHFSRNDGDCFGAGRCRYAEPEMSRCQDGFKWRGPVDEKGADPG